MSEDDEDDGYEVARVHFDAGYLAAVRRFAPLAYHFVKRELASVPAGVITTEHCRELDAANGVSREAPHEELTK
jgi:hypothetical protein